MQADGHAHGLLDIWRGVIDHRIDEHRAVGLRAGGAAAGGRHCAGAGIGEDFQHQRRSPLVADRQRRNGQHAATQRLEFDADLLTDLALSCAMWLGMGRMLRTLDIGQSCKITL